MSSPLSELFPAWESFAHLVHRQEIPAKTTLLHEGETAHHAYFIEKGCLRVWFNDEGKDITFQFFFEGEGVSSVESFRTHQPSLFSIESLEPCVIHAIARADFLAVMEQSPLVREQVEQHTLRRMVYYQKLFLSRIRDNPQQRYQELLESRPDIVRRVPQHYIASYLGITPVSLSRIRNRR